MIIINKLRQINLPTCLFRKVSVETSPFCWGIMALFWSQLKLFCATLQGAAKKLIIFSKIKSQKLIRNQKSHKKTLVTLCKYTAFQKFSYPLFCCFLIFAFQKFSYPNFWSTFESILLYFDDKRSSIRNFCTFQGKQRPF